MLKKIASTKFYPRTNFSLKNFYSLRINPYLLRFGVKEDDGIKTCKLSLDNWNPDNKLFIDGSNLIYMNRITRNFVLKPKLLSVGQELLAEVLHDFHQKMKVKQTRLIYDHTTFKEPEEWQNFGVLSAKSMGFETGDDALVDLAESLNDEATLFITSDRGLIKRLDEKHVKIVRGRDFITFAVSIIYDDNTVNDRTSLALFEQWTSKIQENKFHKNAV